MARTDGTWDFEAALWVYKGKGGWHFVTLPPEVGFAIRCVSEGRRPGWGMVAEVFGLTALGAGFVRSGRS